MKQLFLIRHAKSSWHDTSLADKARPLKATGRRQVVAMAPPLGRLGALQDALFSSDAQRARETIYGLLGCLPDTSTRGALRFDDTLYTFEHKMLRRWLKNVDPALDSLTLIGHEPALTELAEWLTGEAPRTLPTGSLLHIELPVAAWQSLHKRCGKLVHTLSPAEASHALFKRKAPVAPKLEGLSLAERVPAQLTFLYRMIRGLEPGVRKGVDPEFLHQYRVNLRRSRAIAESVLVVAPDPVLAKALKRLKRRAQATSRLRDLEVFAITAEEVLASPASGPLLAFLERLASHEHGILQQALAGRRYRKEMKTWRRRISAKHLRSILDGMDSAAIHDVLAERIDRHDASLAALNDQSPDRDLHELRKQVKRIRYLAELNADEQADLLKQLKTRQTVLGDFQDLTTQLQLLDEFADSVEAHDMDDDVAANLASWRLTLEIRKAERRQDVLALSGLQQALGRHARLAR
ncbi:CHAD domain-containing protein [Halomonas urumqiensis]|uniref:Histidine phosphatase n=1 Tax=Halomonas urumqiensis TaxID=1684789 RepID=A0A2N7UDF8_9GAMM|nr:CHAD domain-containing protein [Halomonas urumqiensis]PMR78457.1 histidine phosphatase [Halomonas urumqiensis]PTB03602.1 CHAD domain-containing protein [Halomonas urumqiensis]GHE20192.1 hypothetical protein GCM10017767_07130 [Halomonas urumqiensis]